MTSTANGPASVGDAAKRVADHARLLARRRREGHTKASLGPFRLVDRG